MMKMHPRDCIGGKVMKTNRMINQIYRKHIAPFGLSNPQVTILFIIKNMVGMNQTKLGFILAMEKSTVSRNVRRLIQDGLIMKKPDKSMSLTKLGERTVKKVMPAWEKAMIETRAILGSDGEQALDKILNKLTN